MSEARITPSLIFHGGRILTAEDAGTTSPGAVAILDNRIVAVGNQGEVLSLAGDATRVIDLTGRTLIPGMIDNHTHYLLAGLDAPEVGVRQYRRMSLDRRTA